MYGFLQEYLVEFAYGGVFLVLLLCGLGLPVPEDIPIITSGYLVHLGTMSFWPALAVNMLGIMLGDLIIYSFGYWMGPRAIEYRLFRSVMTPERMGKVQAFFDRHGKKAIFFGRFIAGLRAPLFLAAGITRLPLRIFFGMDLAAALLSVPLLLVAAWYFGDHIDEFRQMVGTGKAVFILVLGAAALLWGAKYLWRKWRSKDSRPASS